MSKTRQFSYLTLILTAALFLAACTRSAATETLPTIPPEGVGGGGEGADLAATETAVAMMQNILYAGQTQTAQAVLAGSGGGDGLPTATPTSALIISTDTPIAPVAPTATPFPVNPSQYTVKPGDWLYKIARDHNVTPQALMAANPQINPNAVLQPGTVLNIPGAGGVGGGGEVPAGTARTHIVQPGDNLFRIGLANATTYVVLAQLNNIPAPYTVYPGQVINLP
jgi:LysM repeat protein